MSWRFFDRNADGSVEQYSYDPDTGRSAIRHVEDVSHIIDANQRLAGSWDGWNRDRTMRLAARITPAVQYEWLTKFGVRAWDKNHQKAVIRLLNSNEYRHLRIGHFII